MIHRETDGTETTEDEITRIAGTTDMKGNADRRRRRKRTGGTEIEITIETGTNTPDHHPIGTGTGTPNQTVSKKTPQKK